MSIVTAEQLSISFGKKQILDEESFAIQPGDRVIVKPNFVTNKNFHQKLTGDLLACSSTHGSVLRPIIDYALRACGPRGRVVVARGVTDSLRTAAERLLDPRINIHTGARMLGDLMRRLGRIDLALAAWNAGEGSVRRHGGLPPVDETRAHVHLVLELYWALLQNRMGSKARTLAVQ